jgi:uridine phosphorylase
MHPMNFKQQQYHIACKPGDLTEYLLVPGDPDRLPKITKFWDSAEQVAYHREFRSVTGKYKGVPISALSSGIGPACMAIVVNEAFDVGVRTFVRVGSTGAIQEDIPCGDTIISCGAVRLDGASNCYAIPEYPATADYEVLLALIEAAEDLGIKNYHVGITATTADFYAGQSRSTRSSCSGSVENLFPQLQKVGVLNFEMEAATLFTLSSIYGLRAGCICAVFANRCTGEVSPGAGEENAIRIANEAIRILSNWDLMKRSSGKRHFFPSLSETRGRLTSSLERRGVEKRRP